MLYWVAIEHCFHMDLFIIPYKLGSNYEVCGCNRYLWLFS